MIDLKKGLDGFVLNFINEGDVLLLKDGVYHLDKDEFNDAEMLAHVYNISNKEELASRTQKLFDCNDMLWLTEEIANRFIAFGNDQINDYKMLLLAYSRDYDHILKDDASDLVRRDVAARTDKYDEQFKDDAEEAIRFIVVARTRAYDEQFKNDSSEGIRAWCKTWGSCNSGGASKY